jgi:hypothetical protein
MITIIISTAIYQYVLNSAFGPLSKYLPITLDSNVSRYDERLVPLDGIQVLGATTEMPFEHKTFHVGRPVIRIPKDGLGISADEIHQTQTFSKLISISDRGVSLDANGRVKINQFGSSV